MSIPASTSPLNILALAVRTQFANRPTLRSVLTKMLEQQIVEKTAPLNTDISSIFLDFPDDTGGYSSHSLVDVVLGYLASGNAPVFSTATADRPVRLVDAQRQKVTFLSIGDTTESTWPGLSMLEDVIRELPSILHIGFQQALADYWSEPGNADCSRLQWLSDQLRDSLRAAAVRQSGTDGTILRQLADHPCLQDRPAEPAIHAYTLQATASKGLLSASFQSTDLLVTQGARALLCSLSGTLESYASIDEFSQAWGQRVQQPLQLDAFTWKRYEPDGNIFDVQAALLLNQQLEDLAAIKLPAGISTSELENLYARVTDPVSLFADAPPMQRQPLRLLQSTLPSWLKDAAIADQLAYRKHSLELAGARQTAKGKSWAEGIEDIRAFTARTLHEQMVADHSDAPDVSSDDLELTFHVPVGDLGSGYLESVKMSLTDLALKNLAGKPKGSMTLRHLDGKPLAQWMTPEYLLGLVSKVDIGKHFPERIKQLLLSDDADARNREVLFANELKVTLPLDALELAIKGERGFTRRGYQLIAALVQPARSDQFVGEDDIVVRPLALLRKPGADADEVTNMFVIEPADIDRGPHILYRPVYQQSLHQYPTRAALLAAIAEPGEIQTSVLTWLSDRARPIYDLGGFKEPHIVHFTPLDPFGLPDKPRPATLTTAASGEELLASLHNGKLMEYLFGSNARALVDLADRDSISNTESRWAILREGGWLLFNTVLALPLGTPLMLAGWMVSLTNSLIEDIPALSSTDPSVRDPAWIDFLLNIAMVLLHAVQSPDSTDAPITIEKDTGLRVLLEPLRRPPDQPAPPAHLIKPGTVGLPSEPPGGGTTLLDFDKTLARDSSAARLLAKLQSVRVDWPKEPVEPIAIGTLKGLFKIDNTWHASVAGLFFRVSVVPGSGEVFIIHPQKPGHPGIKLKTDGLGHWTLDRGLKLTGGGPKSRIQAKRAEVAASVAQLMIDKQQINARLETLVTTQNQALTSVRQARSDFELQREKLVTAFDNLEAASPTEKDRITQEHQVEQEKTRAAQIALEVTMRLLRRRMDESKPVRRELLDILTRIRALDNAAVHEREQLHALSNISTVQIIYSGMLRDLGRDLFITSRGERVSALLRRMDEQMRRGETDAYEEFFALHKVDLTRADALIECAIWQEQTLEEMGKVSAAGAAARDTLLRQVQLPEVYFSDNLKLQSLNIHKELTLVRTGMIDNETEAFFISQMAGNQFQSAYIAHIETRSRRGYSPDERISLYESAIKQYALSDHATRALEELGSRHVRVQYKDGFIRRLDEARVLAEQDLADAILEVEEAKVLPSTSKPQSRKSDSKRVFKSRNKGTLVGDVRPSQPDAQGEFIDIHDFQSGAIIGTFRKNPQENIYVEVVQAAPVPAKPPARSAATIIAQGRKLLLEREKRVKMINREIKQLDDPVLREEKSPWEWNRLLEQLAEELDSIIDELGRLENPPQETLTAIEDFRAQAQDLREAGRQYRNAGYKRQAPTPDKVFALWKSEELDIHLVKTREATHAKDYLTEFAIRDKQSNEVLWYAHFHYAGSAGPEMDYSVGHLKRADQRNIGFKAQLRQARDNKEVARIWRSKVSPDMARKLFFYTS